MTSKLVVGEEAPCPEGTNSATGFTPHCTSRLNIHNYYTCSNDSKFNILNDAI